MPSKFEKFFWRNIAKYIKKHAFPVFWHLGRPNFGDDINPILLKAILGKDVTWSPRTQPHLLGIGSILEQGNENSYAIGAGFLKQPETNETKLKRVFSLRGHLSAKYLPLKLKPKFYGDLGIFCPILLEDKPIKFRDTGLIPHHTTVSYWKNFLANSASDIFLIDPRQHPLLVLHNIASCKRIASQSLHGLIFADALDIPNAWLSPADSMIGGSFKFFDYYSNTIEPKEPQETLKAFHAKRLIYTVSKYNGDKGEYLKHLLDFIKEITHELAR